MFRKADHLATSYFAQPTHPASLVTLQKLAQILGLRISDLLSESSSLPDDQAEVLLAWLRPLGKEERAFVLDQVKRSCDFLKSRKV